MASLMPKIKKLLKALEVKGKIYLFSKSQVYSQKLGKICTVNKLDVMMPLEEYFEKFPEKRKNGDRYKSDYVRVPVADSFREVDVLLSLADIYKQLRDVEGGDPSG